MTDVNLKQFCSRDPERPYLHAPFSRGEYTYATNGHILVRVPQRCDIPQRDDAPNPDKLFAAIGAPEYFSPPVIALPAAKMKDCEACEGRGSEHDCASCQCPCLVWDGKAQVSTDDRYSALIGGTEFAMGYWRQISKLPGIEISRVGKASKAPMPFRFKGGEGLLMGLNHGTRKRVEIAP